MSSTAAGHRNSSILRGTLAIGHALVPKTGVDLMVLRGLAVAARTAGGKLPHFEREKKESEGLSKVAELLGCVDLEQAFLMLQRFELRILHGHADVREMTVRALHPFFADPEQLANAWLAFVVETGANGAQIHFDTLEGASSVSVEAAPFESSAAKSGRSFTGTRVMRTDARSTWEARSSTSSWESWHDTTAW